MIMKRLSLSKTISISFLGILGLSTAQAQSDSSSGGKVDSGNTDIVEFDVRRNTILNQDTAVYLEDILVDDLNFVGKVGGSYVGAALLANKDYVYLDLNGAAVSVGDRFAIYENRGPVKVPGEFNRDVGHHIRLKGFAEVTKVFENSVIAQIYNASLHIEIGDSIAPLSEVEFKLAPHAPKRMVRGKVLVGVRDFSLISPHDFAFINRGSKDGLEVNDRLYVYRTADSADTLEKNRPPMNIAEVVVVHTGEHVATVYTIGSQDAYGTGASFKSAISEVQFLDDKKLADTKNQTTATENTAVAEEEPETLDFSAAADKAFFSLGLGTKIPINRDGVKSPDFSFLIDFGSRAWKSPIYLTILNSASSEIGWAPQYRMRLPLFEKLQHLFFYGGVGPIGTMAIDSSGRQRIYSIRVGVQLHPEIRYFFDDQFFASLSPLVADIYFYDYVNTGANKSNGIDVKAAISTYLNIGMSF